ncbi:MAG: hypothetical protein J1F66_05230 [Clostridiales bacterium]|nr:hypothetical protein [Clostridiales bacterium]
MLGEGIEQLYVFVVFVVLAVLLAAVYIFGLGLFRSRLAGTIFDCLWGVVSLWLVWRTNLSVNNGQCRLYLFIALAAGAVIAYFTCKSTLDKASALLYNLFTTKLVDKSDGSDILQKNNLDTVRDGDIGTTDTRLHAVDTVDADVVAKRKSRSVKRKNSTGKVRSRSPRKTTRRKRLDRVHNKVG